MRKSYKCKGFVINYLMKFTYLSVS